MRLNLGCGNKAKEGFVGVDRHPCDAAKCLVDIGGALPFRADSVDEVWMDNVIEHIPDLPRLFAELHRVCKPGAKLTITTPHFASQASWRDPTHIHHLSYFSMDHFERANVAHYMRGGYRVLDRKLSFGGLGGAVGRMICALSPRKYELRWCFIFRPSTLTFVMQVEKG